MLFGAKTQYFSPTGLEPAKKDTNKRLAIQSLILSIVGCILVIAFVVLGSLCAQNMLNAQLDDGETSFPILSLIGVIAFFGLALIFLTSCQLSSINFAVYQKKLNNLKIGNVSLIVSLVL